MNVMTPEAMREAAARIVSNEFGKQMARLSSNESGRLLETSLQLMDEDVFRTLAYLVVNSEKDMVVQELISDIVFKIASKLGRNFETIEPIQEAAGAAWVIIHCENQRRKGNVEYSAPNDIFTDNPKYPGFNRLTDIGKDIYYKQLLELPLDHKYIM